MAGLDQSMIPFASFRNQLEQSMNQTRTTMLDQSHLRIGDRRQRVPYSRPADRHYVSSKTDQVPEVDISLVESRIVIGASVYPPSNISSILGQSAIPDTSVVGMNGTEDVPSGGLNMLAQNHENVPDPTMGVSFELDLGDNRSQKFDELYQKVLMDAEGALMHTKADRNMNTVPHMKHRSKTVEGRSVEGTKNEGHRRTSIKNDDHMNLSEHSMKCAHSGSDQSNNSYNSTKSAMSTDSQKSIPPKPAPRLSEHELSISPGKSQNMSAEYSECFEPSAVSILSNHSSAKLLEDEDDSDIEELLEIATNSRHEDELQDF